MRLRVARIGVLAALAGALSLPATASAQCDLPKGYYTASAQYEYALNTEMGILGTRLQNQMPPVGSELDVNHLIQNAPYTAQAIASAVGDSASYLGLATYNFATAAATAIASDPPECVSRAAAPARKRAAKRSSRRRAR